MAKAIHELFSMKAYESIILTYKSRAEEIHFAREWREEKTRHKCDENESKVRDTELKLSVEGRSAEMYQLLGHIWSASSLGA